MKEFLHCLKTTVTAKRHTEMKFRCLLPRPSVPGLSSIIAITWALTRSTEPQPPSPDPPEQNLPFIRCPGDLHIPVGRSLTPSNAGKKEDFPRSQGMRWMSHLLRIQNLRVPKFSDWHKQYLMQYLNIHMYILKYKSTWTSAVFFLDPRERGQKKLLGKIWVLWFLVYSNYSEFSASEIALSHFHFGLHTPILLDFQTLWLYPKNLAI